jgi:RNA-directed DNA polymerase
MNRSNDSILAVRLFEAYYRARRNKRNTWNQLKFEIDFEHNLLQLAEEIEQRQYKPKPCIAFVVNKPVKREIFAADFRDRVVHHLLHGSINYVVEGKLIHDTYSCRKGKGTLYGIKRIDKFIRSCSRNYQRDAYILKLDVTGYFRNMRHDILWEKVQKIVSGRKSDYGGLSREIVDYLLHRIIHTHAADNCTVKCSRAEWKGLPKSKSLFYADSGCGLPIGNLTSQLFGNVFLNDFDQFVKHRLGIQYYGRYVETILLLLRLTKDLQVIGNKPFVFLNSKVEEVSVQLVGWQKYMTGVVK